MNKMIFDENYNMIDFTIVLSTRSYEHLGALTNVDNSGITYNASLNSANELSFKAYKTMNGYTEKLWDSITDLKLVWVKELNEYFEIKVTSDDSDAPVKSVTATSLCESELGQTNLYDIEINTESDIARDDYVITKFYDKENPKGSLLHRILEKVPHYSVKHVDASLKDIQRSFSINGTSVYDFLTGECAEQLNCLFTFDSTDRSISVYDLYTVCNDCGYRGEYSDVCPECGSKNLKYFGEDTTIYIDKENLTDSVTFETDVDSIKNCFRLEAGDDFMTAAIRALNQNGSDYLYYLSEEQKADMPGELVEKLKSYDILYDSYTDEYKILMENLYESIDKILYYTSEMMPSMEHAEVTAATEAAKLTAAHLNPLGLSSVTTSTSAATVDSAMKNYAKVFVKTGYVRLEVNESSFQYIGTDNNGYSYGNWTGNFKITNYSDETDVVISNTISVKVYDNYQDFIEQKIKKNIANHNDDDGSVFDVLSIENLTQFKTALKSYCLNRLTSFYDAIQGAMDVLIQVDQASEEADLYETLYVPYYNKLQACQAEIDIRQATIDEWQHTYDTLEKRKNEIQSALNFENYLEEDLYPIFCSYRREDTYSNSNYISDGLNNAELFEKAREFIDTAKKELYQSGEHQHVISSPLYNLLLIPEFKILLDKFELGNWIRVGVDENVYRLRLIGYTINFSDLQNLEVTFSDVTKIRDGISDLNSILSSVQSMASTYDYVSRQAENGSTAQENMNEWVANGLNSALVRIKNNENEEITYGKYGLSAKEYDDITESYSPEQLQITHNLIALTDNNWQSVSLAIGKHQYTYYDETKKSFEKSTGYGVSAKFLQSPFMTGGQIIGGDIYSDNYSSASGTHINLRDGSFSFAGGNLSYDNNILNVKGTITATSLTLENCKIDASDISNLPKTDLTGYIKTDGIIGSVADTGSTGFTVSGSGLLQARNAVIYGSIYASGGTIAGWTLTGTDLYDATGNVCAGIGKNGTSSAFWAGTDYSNRNSAPFRVGHDGSLTASNAYITGNVNATSGTIGELIIDGEGLRNKDYAFDTVNNRVTNGFQIRNSGSIAMTHGTIGCMQFGVDGLSTPDYEVRITIENGLESFAGSWLYKDDELPAKPSRIAIKDAGIAFSRFNQNTWEYDSPHGLIGGNGILYTQPAAINLNGSGSSINVNGNITSNGSILTSDKRLKTNISYIDTYDSYINMAKDLKLSTFRFLNSPEDKFGIIAQDILSLCEKYQINSELFVKKNDNGYYAIDYIALNLLSFMWLSDLEKRMN